TYTEDAAEYQEVMDRLARKFDTARAHVPPPVIEYAHDTAPGRKARPRPTRCGIVSLGSCDLAVREARKTLQAGGTSLDYCRVRAFPFTVEVERFLAEHETIFVVEQNRDAQLRGMLLME